MRFITLDENKQVVGIRFGNGLVLGEIESETGEIGQIMQEDGSFITPIAPIPTVTLSLDERIQQIQQDNLILMDALASVYEELITIKAGGTV